MPSPAVTAWLQLLIAGSSYTVLLSTQSDSVKLRFRDVPLYGHGVIHKFANNTSEMKRLAARDFEDILQVCFTDSIVDMHHLHLSECAMLVFEGLFPCDHDGIIQTLLYRFAQWHALAKLKLHSETTLTFLDETFQRLSRQLQKFRDFTCAAFTTVELPEEKAARERSGVNNTNDGSGSQKGKKFNMNTYEFHAMGDYLHSIQLFGTTDSFTSQIVHESLLYVHNSV
jgi:hypothetical protein